jgi:hypothetical protein
MESKPEKIEVKSIRIYGSESNYAGDHTFDNWYHAGVHIRGIAMFAPRGGAYDKTKFDVVFEDGSNYSGRLDIQHYTMPYEGNDNDLAKHINEHCRFHSGQWCPPHMTREDYEGALRAYGKDSQKEYQEFLTKYDIPKTDGLVNIGKLVLCLGCQKPHTKNSDKSLCGRCSYESEDRDRQKAEREAVQKEKEADPLYPILQEGRTAVTKKMRQLLRQRSGKAWSVTGGRGTGWGWLTIDAPPARIDNGRMTSEDQAELALLLGETKVHCQGVSISGSEWWHYLKACRGDFSEEKQMSKLFNR